MTRSEIITELKNYFALPDLVCPDTFKTFGLKAWQFLRTDYLHTLLIVRRDILKSPMICNNFFSGGKTYTQRGLRCNLCEIVKEKSDQGKIYLSAHLTGCAGDFNVVGMTSVQARHLIIDNIDKLPYPIRMEDGMTWLHLDTYDSGNSEPYTLFTP
jgi:hypothetical protein